MKEKEIRPSKIFDQYLSLAKDDSYTYFSGVKSVLGDCPACLSQSSLAFEKHGFTYHQCEECLTLFVNPRPIAAAFIKYYTESPSAKFWASTFYRQTASARREKLWRPKARQILSTLERYSAANHQIIDIGGGFGLFAEEIKSISESQPIIIEPGPDLAKACRERSLCVIEKFLEEVQNDDLPVGPKAFVSFELFEHLHDPTYFLKHLSGLMSSGDLFIFTTLSGLGVDIQTLWDNSKSVSPPYHLNFFNPHAVRILLERLDFIVLEVSTPGKLDIDIMINNCSLIKDRFWKNLIKSATEEEKIDWQDFISAKGMSSHMMTVCKAL
jgi:hypothetical protein